MEVSRTIRIRRPAEEVFEFLTDVSRMPSWQPGVTRTRVTSPGAAGVGSTYRSHGSVFTARSRITAFDPPRHMALSTDFGWGRGDIEYDLRNVDGETALTAVVRAQPGFLARTLVSGEEMMRRGIDEIEGSLDRLKDVLEKESPVSE